MLCYLTFLYSVLRLNCVNSTVTGTPSLHPRQLLLHVSPPISRRSHLAGSCTVMTAYLSDEKANADRTCYKAQQNETAGLVGYGARVHVVRVGSTVEKLPHMARWGPSANTEEGASQEANLLDPCSQKQRLSQVPSRRGSDFDG